MRADVGLHGGLAGEELSADLGVGQSLGHRLEHLALLLRQRQELRRRGRARLELAVQQGREVLRGEDRVAGVHRADRVAQHRRRGALEQEAAGAVPDRGGRAVVEVEGRQDDDPDGPLASPRRARAGRSAGSPPRRPSPASGCPSAPRRARARRPAAPPRGRRRPSPPPGAPPGRPRSPARPRGRGPGRRPGAPGSSRSPGVPDRHPRGRGERRRIACAVVRRAGPRPTPAGAASRRAPGRRSRAGCRRRSAACRRAPRARRSEPRCGGRPPSAARRARAGRAGRA